VSVVIREPVLSGINEESIISDTSVEKSTGKKLRRKLSPTHRVERFKPRFFKARIIKVQKQLATSRKKDERAVENRAIGSEQRSKNESNEFCRRAMKDAAGKYKVAADHIF
jgi:hypothetical protein